LKKLAAPQACLREVSLLSCSDEDRARCTGHAEASGYNGTIKHFQGKSAIPLCCPLATWGEMFQQRKKTAFSHWSLKSCKLEVMKGSVNFCSVKTKGNEARLTTWGKVTI